MNGECNSPLQAYLDYCIGRVGAHSGAILQSTGKGMQVLAGRNLDHSLVDEVLDAGTSHSIRTDFLEIELPEPHKNMVSSLGALDLSETTVLILATAAGTSRRQIDSDELELLRKQGASLLRLQSSIPTSADPLIRGLREVIRIAQELLACSTVDEVYHGAVTAARERLGLERCSLYLQGPELITGTYGTDEQGRTIAEHSLQFPLNDLWRQHFHMTWDHQAPYFVTQGEHNYWDGEKTVMIGGGWIVLTPIESMERPVGVFVNDAGLSGAPLNKERQELIAIYAALLGNIIERKRAEIELREAKDAAESADRAKTRFLSSVSHELRTPMNGIMGACELLRRTRLEEIQTRYVSAIGTSAEHLLVLLNDLLDIARIEAGMLSINESDVEVAGIVREVGEILAAAASEKGLTIDIRVEPAADRWIHTDANRLRQILFNLLGNAVKFTAEGHIELRLGMRGDEEILIEVSDTGIGIEEEKVEQLFIPFVQIRDSDRTDGSGLGLAISRQLVHLLGGEIGYRRNAASGSTFWVTLPTREPKNPQPSNGENPIGQCNSDPHLLAGRNVLIVEDQRLNRFVLEGFLAELGARCDAAEDGPRALQMISSGNRNYDVVLLDVHLPGMDGFEIARRIRTLPGEESQTPLIAVSAGTAGNIAQEARDAGMDGAILKPIRLEQLAAVLRDVLPPGETSPPPAPKAPALDETLREFYIADMEDQLKALAPAMESKDWRVVERTAHAMAGINAQTGFTAIEESARALMTAARNSNESEANDLAAKIRSAYRCMLDQEE
ncbi:response regulator [bacterium]|nr:response regulator [bacterium]